MSTLGHGEHAVITSVNVREYFLQELQHAIDKQHVKASADATCYVLNLLTTFVRSDRLYEDTQEGKTLRPLAEMYADALDAPNPEARNVLLRRLADVALFVSGIFSDSLKRKTVDVNYYVAMGGSAYAYLSDNTSRLASARALVPIFGELAAKFQQFVEVLNEVSERAHLNSDSDLFRAYELWLKTGSRHAHGKLLEHGVQPVWVPAGSRLQ